MIWLYLGHMTDHLATPCLGMAWLLHIRPAAKPNHPLELLLSYKVFSFFPKQQR